MIHSSVKVGSLIKHKNSGAILKISKINPKSIECIVVKVDNNTPKHLKVGSKDIVSVEKMSKINFNKFYENVDKIEESSSDKYSTVEKTKRGFTVIIPYPEESGIETLDGLYDWESKDPSNRKVLNVAKDKKEAEKLIKDYKIFESKNESILESFISFDEFLLQEAKVNKLKEGEFYTYTGGAEHMKVKYIGRKEDHKDIKIGSSMGKGFVFEWPEGDKFFELGHNSIKEYIHDDIDESKSDEKEVIFEFPDKEIKVVSYHGKGMAGEPMEFVYVYHKDKLVKLEDVSKLLDKKDLDEVEDYIKNVTDSNYANAISFVESVSESKILNDEQALELIKKVKDIVPDAADAVEEYVVGTLGKSKLSTIERILADYDLTLDDLDESLSESFKWKQSRNANVEGYVAKSFPHSKGDGDRLLDEAARLGSSRWLTIRKELINQYGFNSEKNQRVSKEFTLENDEEATFILTCDESNQEITLEVLDEKGKIIHTSYFDAEGMSASEINDNINYPDAFNESESFKWKQSRNANVEGYVAKSFPHSKGDGDRLLDKEVLRKKWSTRLTKWLGVEIDLKDVKDFFTAAYKEFGFTFKDKDGNEYRIYSPGEGPKSQEYHVQKLKK